MRDNPIIPNWLNAGDKIALISSARKVDRIELQKYLMHCDNWPFEFFVDEDLFNEEFQFAGSDEHRAAQFEKALLDDSVKAIMFVKGGYGSARLLEYFDHTLIRKNPKWLIGYSDVCTLHHLYNMNGVASLHATMPVSFPSNTARSIELIVPALMGELNQHKEAVRVQGQGEFSGTLVGGNLSLVYSLLSDQHKVNWEECVLFIEDLDEYLYHIDRMMMALRNAGILHRIRGLLVGTMTDMRDNTREYGFSTDNPFGHSVDDILRHAMRGTTCPWVMDFPAGHGADNLPLFFGLPVRGIAGDGHLSISFEY